MTVYCLYFSPCGSCRSCAKAAAEGFAGEDYEEINLTNRSQDLPEAGAGDVLIISAPVYGGRIPLPLAQKIARASLSGAAAVAMVVYGNRAYEDALIELSDLLTQAGASVAAGGAFIARHVFVPEVAEGRPNENDLAQLKSFGKSAARKIASGSFEPVQVPGSRPYRDRSPASFTPVVDADACQQCGLCARSCPTGAINPKNPHETDITLCIDCMRCVQGCPEEARSLPAKAKEFLTTKLSPLISITRENEIFL